MGCERRKIDTFLLEKSSTVVETSQTLNSALNHPNITTPAINNTHGSSIIRHANPAAINNLQVANEVKGNDVLHINGDDEINNDVNEAFNNSDNNCWHTDIM